MLIIRDVRDTVMILYMICQLVCVTNPWAHMSFMHSILSLKLGVTNLDLLKVLTAVNQCQPF